jgi:DNA-binding transcriptional MerR regulator
MASDYLAIGELARRTDTKVETIRFYEKTGLLPEPGRTSGNYRAYGAEHLNRLSFVRRARGLGFSIEQIRVLLALADDKNQPCEEIDVIAVKHLEYIDRKIKDLCALRREIDNMIRQCKCGTVAECRIIEALSPDQKVA